MSQSPSSESNLPEIPDHASVDSGEYFSQGRRWSRLMFEAPIIERSYLLLFLSIIGLTAILAFASLTSLFPLELPVRMVFTNDNSGFEFPKLIRIARKNEPLQEALGRYIAGQYITAYESYEYDRDIVNERYNFVYKNSSPEVFNRYRQSLSVSNPQSPINMLGQDGKVQLDIINSRVLDKSVHDGLVDLTIEVNYIENLSKETLNFTRKKVLLQVTMHEITIHKPSKSVYQYNSSTREYEKLEGGILFRVNSYANETRQSKNAQKS
jgi:type IV secretory pathway component VirB8